MMLLALQPTLQQLSGSLLSRTVVSYVLFLESKHVDDRPRIPQVTMICICTGFLTKATATQVHKRHEARIPTLKLKSWEIWKQPAMDPAAFSRLSLAQTSQQTKAPLPSACTREEDEVVFKPRRSRQSRNGEQGATRVQAPTCRTDSETLGNAATAQTNPPPQSGENKNVTPRGRTPKSKAVYESDILTSTRQSVSLSKKAMKQLEGSPKVNTYLTHKSNHTHPCTIVPAYGPLNVSPLGGASLTSKPPHNAFIPYQTSRLVRVFRLSLRIVLTNCIDSPQPSVDSNSHQHSNISSPKIVQNGLAPLHLILDTKIRA